MNVVKYNCVSVVATRWFRDGSGIFKSVGILSIVDLSVQVLKYVRGLSLDFSYFLIVILLFRPFLLFSDLAYISLETSNTSTMFRMLQKTYGNWRFDVSQIFSLILMIDAEV